MGAGLSNFIQADDSADENFDHAASVALNLIYRTLAE
jgi:hypothetical protein